jgi:hypothetical protein
VAVAGSATEKKVRGSELEACDALLRTGDRSVEGVREALLAADPPAVAVDEGLPAVRGW